MPAIDRSRLKTQTARLADKFGEPALFVHELDELLDHYTNRTIRTTQFLQRRSLPTYRTPRPVLRLIESELSALAETRPVEAVALTSALWEATTLEARLLAACLLGAIPPTQAMSALTRLPDWLGQSVDKEIRQALLTDALARLRVENPEAFFLLLEDWLKSPRSELQVWGFQALMPLLDQPGFENLPAVFRILQPAIESAGPATQLDLQACLAGLGRLSPTETLVFLRGFISGDSDPQMLRFLRRILLALPEEVQSGLRAALRTAGSP